MPSWSPPRSEPPPGPSPFSSEWLRSPTPPAPRRRVPALPAWMPGARALSATLVLLLAATTAIVAGGGGPDEAGWARLGANAPEETLSAAVVAATEVVAELEDATSAPTLAPEAPTTVAPALAVGAAAPPPTPTYVPMPAFSPAPVVDEQAGQEFPGALLPANRILTYYGHPHDQNMGILGEESIEDLERILREEAANYQAADPSRPVIPAFEVIATVAQPVPGNDGTYILDTDRRTIQTYVDYAAANDMLVFLDLQIGRGTVADEIEKVRPFLELAHVHLALDPEFAIAEGETPGDYIGELTAESITYAQETLAALSAELGLPPKVLIVHQFREDMIVDKDTLAPVPGVQLVLDADGYGAPELKVDVYNILVRDEPIEFGGVKLFYKQDKPLMTAAEVLALNPSPDLIIYQ